MPTKAVAFRLTAEDRARAQEIRDHYGLPSIASALRHAMRINCNIIKAGLVKRAERKVRE